VVTLVILCVPPLLQCAATLVYGCTQALFFFPFPPLTRSSGITVRHLLRHRASNKFLTPFLTSRDPSLSSSHTLRLFALSILLGITITIWMATELQEVITRPERLASWKVIHETDGNILTLSRSMLMPVHFRSLMIRWWAIPAESYTFFILFATSRDVLAEYHKIWVWFKTAVLKRPAPEEWKWMRTKPGYAVV
jgi:pheromone a factor receptor